MPLYRVVKPSFIDNKTVEVGAEIEYAGIPSGNLEPLDDAAKAAVEAAKLNSPQSKAPDYAALLKQIADLQEQITALSAKPEKAPKIL